MNILWIKDGKKGHEKQVSVFNTSGQWRTLVFYCFRIDWLKDNLDKVAQSKITKEFYLTELIAIAHGQGHHIDSYLDTSSIEIMGVNNKLELSIAEKIIQKKILNNLMMYFYDRY